MAVFGVVCAATTALAQQPQIDPARLKAAESLAQLVNSPEQQNKTFAAMRPALMHMFVAQEGMPSDKAAQLFDTVLLPSLHSHIGDIVEARAKILAGIFTVDELNQIAVFYRTPVGQKYIANEGTIASSMAAAMQPLMRDMLMRSMTFAKTHPTPKAQQP